MYKAILSTCNRNKLAFPNSFPPLSVNVLFCLVISPFFSLSFPLGSLVLLQEKHQCLYPACLSRRACLFFTVLVCDSYYHSGGNTTSRMPVAACHKPKLGGEGHFSYKSWNKAVSKPLASQAERTAVNRLQLHIVTALGNTNGTIVTNACKARKNALIVCVRWWVSLKVLPNRNIQSMRHQKGILNLVGCLKCPEFSLCSTPPSIRGFNSTMENSLNEPHLRCQNWQRWHQNPSTKHWQTLLCLALFPNIAYIIT